MIRSVSLTGMLFPQIFYMALFKKMQNLKIRKRMSSVFFQCPVETLFTRPTQGLFRRMEYFDSLFMTD